MVISLKPIKQINLYRFKIHIFYRKLARHRNSAQIYHFNQKYITKKQLKFFYVEKNMVPPATRRGALASIYIYMLFLAFHFT